MVFLTEFSLNFILHRKFFTKDLPITDITCLIEIRNFWHCTKITNIFHLVLGTIFLLNCFQREIRLRLKEVRVIAFLLFVPLLMGKYWSILLTMNKRLSKGKKEKVIFHIRKYVCFIVAAEFLKINAFLPVSSYVSNSRLYFTMVQQHQSVA